MNNDLCTCGHGKEAHYHTFIGRTSCRGEGCTCQRFIDQTHQEELERELARLSDSSGPRAALEMDLAQLMTHFSRKTGLYVSHIAIKTMMHGSAFHGMQAAYLVEIDTKPLNEDEEP